jgi:hypothetical protein
LLLKKDRLHLSLEKGTGNDTGLTLKNTVKTRNTAKSFKTNQKLDLFSCSQTCERSFLIKNSELGEGFTPDILRILDDKIQLHVKLPSNKLKNRRNYITSYLQQRRGKKFSINTIVGISSVAETTATNKKTIKSV